MLIFKELIRIKEFQESFHFLLFLNLYYILSCRKKLGGFLHVYLIKFQIRKSFLKLTTAKNIENEIESFTF